MHTSKIIQLFKILSDTDIQSFSKYAQQFHSVLDEEAYTLFQYLKRFAPAFTSNRLKRAIVCRHLLKNEVIDNKRLNKIAHRLKVLIEDFLIYADLEAQPLLKKQLLLRSLKKRNAPDLIQKSEAIIQQIEIKKQLSMREQLDLFLLHNDLWSDINTNKIKGSITHFSQANTHLDTFYFRQKLALIVEYKALKKIRQDDFQMPLEQPILKLIRTDSNLKNNVSTQLWLAAIQMQQSDKKEDFLALKRLFFDCFDQLTRPEAQDVFIILANFFNKAINIEPAFYNYESFLLYRFAFNQNLLIENDRVRAIEFINTASIGFKAKQNEWTFKFIETYKPKLSKSIRDAAYAQVTALHHFVQGSFIEADDWIIKVNSYHHNSLVIEIKTRMLKLRTMYEILQKGHFKDDGYIQTIESFVKSFTNFIQNHSGLPVIKKEKYHAFINFFRRILRLIKSNNLDKIAQLRPDIEDNLTVPHRIWLLEKLDQIKITRPTN